MNEPKHTWNPDDGPPPTDEELRAAAALADALEGRGAPAPDDDALLSTALRVRAVASPDGAASKAASERAVRDALQRRQARSWWSSGSRLRLAAAAAAVLATVGVGGSQYLRARAVGSVATISRPAGDVFDAPVEPGAGSTPASRIYDSRMRSYRAALLGGAQ